MFPPRAHRPTPKHSARSPPESADVLPEGERRQATVVILRLSGYADLVERCSPQEVDELTRRLKHGAWEIVERHGGTINEFGEERIVLVFGVPVSLEDHCARATRAALELRTLVRAGRTGTLGRASSRSAHGDRYGRSCRATSRNLDRPVSDCRMADATCRTALFACARRRGAADAGCRARRGRAVPPGTGRSGVASRGVDACDAVCSCRGTGSSGSTRPTGRSRRLDRVHRAREGTGDADAGVRRRDGGARETCDDLRRCGARQKPIAAGIAADARSRDCDGADWPLLVVRSGDSLLAVPAGVAPAPGARASDGVDVDG